MPTSAYGFTTLNASDTAGHQSINVLVNSIANKLLIASSGLDKAARGVALTSGYTLVWNGSTFADAQVSSAGIADGAITTAKLDNGAVTGAKIATGTIQPNNLDPSVLTGGSAPWATTSTLTAAGMTSNAGITSNNTVTATNGFVGNVTGNVTGNVSGSAASATNATTASGLNAGTYSVSINGSAASATNAGTASALNAGVYSIGINGLSSGGFYLWNNNLNTLASLNSNQSINASSNGVENGTVNTGNYGIYSQGVTNNPTANPANVRVQTAFPYAFERSTSSGKYKTNIRDYILDVNKLMTLRGVVFNSICETDDNSIDIVGFIAEEAVDAGLVEFVEIDTDGEVQNFHYTQFTAALLEFCKYQENRINDLEARIVELESV